ncbi:hypothetical protein SAMN04488128_103312 [Chitinophaga eiseniae]|uniref:Uncharacterized protein n=1 Tax=Chitinophaga eiseniae TaxID=634771 RepID=A0A1T4SQX3_9BACT|nr:hypothetical protein [Chitinophaga eiseniae]SKA30556.1 hypothetical protein SAMN04488128_103312 [Chitinophaga eiseniae]
MKQILNLILLTIVCFSCEGPGPKDEKQTESIQKEEKYFTVKENIDLLVSPSASSKKLINVKATSLVKATKYCELDKSCKLSVLETCKKYSKVKVIEPDWLTDTYIGWVPTDMLIKFGSIAPAKQGASKIAVFNNVNGLRTELSKNGIGELGSWRSDDLGGFMSITDYYRFGTASSVNGLDNNLAYYLESNHETYAEKLTLVLNIFNSTERNAAISKFKATTEKTFGALNLTTPPGLIKAVGIPKPYTYNNKFFRVSLEREQNNIETWKLTIMSQ